MNYWNQIAKMLGVEIEEEFKIEGRTQWDYRISNRGLGIHARLGEYWQLANSALLDGVLCGLYKIGKITDGKFCPIYGAKMDK